MAARWRVTYDRPRSELTSDGRFTPHREIGFEVLDTGSIGEVLIPMRAYTPEMVAAEIQAQADTILAVSRAGTG